MPTSSQSQELYKIKTISALTGFNPTLLRAWERRYNLLLPVRTPSGHRLYTAEDLQVLRRVRVLLDQGRSIGEVVAHGRSSLITTSPKPSQSSKPPAISEEPGQYPELQRIRDDLVSAALELSDEKIQHSLDLAFGSVSPVRAMEQVVSPAAREIGRLWSLQMASIASEHLLTSCLQRRLQRLIQTEEHRPARYQAICSGFPGEFHELGSHIITYYLMQLGVRVIHLGAALPFEELSRVIQARQPDLVLLSVTRKEVLEAHKESLLQVVKQHQGRARFVIGGGGVEPATLPDLAKLGVILWSADRPLGELKNNLYLNGTT